MVNKVTFNIDTKPKMFLSTLRKWINKKLILIKYWGQIKGTTERYLKFIKMLHGEKVKFTLSLTSSISILHFHLFDLLREDCIRNESPMGRCSETLCRDQQWVKWHSPSMWTLGDRVRSGQLNAECRLCWKNSVTKR